MFVFAAIFILFTLSSIVNAGSWLPWKKHDTKVVNLEGVTQTPRSPRTKKSPRWPKSPRTQSPRVQEMKTILTSPFDVFITGMNEIMGNPDRYSAFNDMGQKLEQSIGTVLGKIRASRECQYKPDATITLVPLMYFDLLLKSNLLGSRKDIQQRLPPLNNITKKLLQKMEGGCPPNFWPTN